MARHARLIGLLGSLLAISALAPVSGALASAAPAPVQAAPVPAVVCPGNALNADTDLASIPAVGPSVIEVIDSGDCVGLSTTIRPLTVTAVRSTSGLGSVTTDGTRVFYNPTACRTGTDFVDYTITDGSMTPAGQLVTDTGTLIVSITRPPTSPLADAPSAGFVSGGIIGSTVPVKLSWCGVPTSSASRISSYRLEQTTNAAVPAPAFSAITTAKAATSMARSVAINRSYAWRIKAKDNKGHTSAAYGQSLSSRVTSYQDNGGKITYSTGWKTAVSSKYSGGREHYVARTGATATLKASNVRQFAIVASRGSGRGSFYVYVDGKRVTSAISQRAATIYRRILYVGSIPGNTLAEHTIQVRTANGSRVGLDTILTMSGRPAQTVTFDPTVPATAIVNGAPDTVAATSSSGLPVSLSIGSSSWASCALAAGTVSYHGRGTCTIQASVAPDPSWDATVLAGAIPVAGLPQAITFDSLADATYGDDAVTATATSDADPVLAVELSSQTTAVCTVSGTTVSIRAAGICTVRASQPGDTTRAAATPVDQSFDVAQVPLTVTGITASGRPYDGTTVAELDTTNAALVGVLRIDDVTLETAGATGAFDDANAAPGKTVQVSGLALAGTKAGNYALAQPTTTATIAKAPQLIDFTTIEPAYPVRDGPTYTPAATSDSGLLVTLTVTSIPGGVCAIDGSHVVTFVTSGQCVVNADQAGNGNYLAAARVVQNLTVHDTGTTPQVITFAAPGSATYGGAPVALAATSDSGLTVALVSDNPSVCTISATNAVLGIAGTCHITASQAGNPTFEAAIPVERTLIVNPRAITVTAAAATKVYDGFVTSAGVPTITSGTGLASGDTATWTQTYDTPAVGSGKTLTPAGTVRKGAVDVTTSYTITFVPVGTGAINPGAAAMLQVTGFTTPTTAGDAHDLTVTAKDAFGNTATGYTGTVHFTSSDGQALLPANYHFLAGDAGVHTFTGVTALKSVGPQSITATDVGTPSINGFQGPITVNPAPAASLIVTALSPQTAGTPFSVTVTAQDAFGNTATGYRGLIHFTSTDPGLETLPGDYTFLAGDNGVHTFTNAVSLVTVTATATITATGTGPIAGTSDPIAVGPATAASLTVTASSPQVAGAPFSVTVTAKDAFNNTATGYTGTVHFTSSDTGTEILPGDYTFVSGDNGVHTFTGGVTLVTVGSWTVTATDTGTGTINGTSSAITVSAGVVHHLAVSGFTTPTVAGAPHNVTVTAQDVNDNTVTGYAGTVQVASTDPQATLPSNATLTNGQGTFSVTLRTAPTQSITASQVGNPAITGTQSGITVNSTGTVTGFTVTGYPTTTIAGDSHSVTVTAVDTYGNTVAGYGSLVQVVSSDPLAILPTSSTLTAGVGTFPVTLMTAGTNRSITARQQGTPSINGSQSGITVDPGPATTLTVVAGTSQTAGTAFTVTVTAKDAGGNTAPGYLGQVAFTSTDGAATLPSPYTFNVGDAGVHVFTNQATLRTAGSRSITVTDTGNASVTGMQAGITVTSASASTLVVSGYPSSTVAGASHPVAVTAKDAFGNTDTAYAGTVAITSSDGQAVLPSSGPLTSGTGSFSVTLGTAGTQTITATGTGPITGSQAGITVTPGTATHLTVTGFPSPATAGVSGTVTVTAKDALGNTVTGYGGTVTITSTDPSADLPPSAGLTNGVGTFAVTLRTAGSRTITATGAGPVITGTQSSIMVNPAAASTFTVTAPTPQTAGTAFSVTVTAKDAFGNTATGYTGTVGFSSTDPGAETLPANYPFLAGDGGSRTFPTGVVLVTAGSWTITATDTVSSAITGTSGTILANPGAAATLQVTGFPGSTVAGTLGSVTVTARDAHGNIATAYGGTVHLTSTDGLADLGPNNTLASGTRSFAVTLKTAGTQSVTATDTVTASITGSQAAITVTPAAAADIVIATAAGGGTAVGATNVQSGSSLTVYANSVDAFGNVIANVAAAWTLTGSTGGIVNGDLDPAPDTKSAVLTGLLVGTTTIHAVGAGFNDDTGLITVTPGPTATISVEDADTGLGNPVGPQSLASGAGITVYPVARDVAGNLISAPTSTFTLPAKSGGVVNGDLVAAGDGKSAVFSGHLVGTATIRAAAGALHGDSGTITVTPGAADHLVLTPGTTSLVAGDNQAFTAVAFDAAGNSLGDVTGSATFSIAPNGSCTLASCTASVAGAHLVTGDVGGGVTGTANVTVTPGAPSLATSTITAAPSTLVGNGTSTSTITVVLRDAFNNPLSASGGTVTLSVTGGGAGGTLGLVSDNGNGTYTATYTSTAATGSDTITGELDAQPLADDATITLIP